MGTAMTRGTQQTRGIGAIPVEIIRTFRPLIECFKYFRRIKFFVAVQAIRLLKPGLSWINFFNGFYRSRFKVRHHDINAGFILFFFPFKKSQRVVLQGSVAGSACQSEHIMNSTLAFGHTVGFSGMTFSTDIPVSICQIISVKTMY